MWGKYAHMEIIFLSENHQKDFGNTDLVQRM